MSKVKEILLIRHGQGDHNVLFAEGRKKEAFALRDPAINDIGIEQATTLGDRNRPNQEILVPDWLINNHVTLKTSSDWLLLNKFQ